MVNFIIWKNIYKTNKKDIIQLWIIWNNKKYGEAQKELFMEKEEF